MPQASYPLGRILTRSCAYALGTIDAPGARARLGIMADIKVGDTVRLKSGGPLMTVDAEGANGFLSCVWFDGRTPKKEMYKATSLMPATPVKDDDYPRDS